ncbi:hypothetical protein [Terriglobus roseus]
MCHRVPPRSVSVWTQ